MTWDSNPRVRTHCGLNTTPWTARAAMQHCSSKVVICHLSTSCNPQGQFDSFLYLTTRHRTRELERVWLLSVRFNNNNNTAQKMMKGSGYCSSDESADTVNHANVLSVCSLCMHRSASSYSHNLAPTTVNTRVSH